MKPTSSEWLVPSGGDGAAQGPLVHRASGLPDEPLQGAAVPRPEAGWTTPYLLTQPSSASSFQSHIYSHTKH